MTAARRPAHRVASPGTVAALATLTPLCLAGAVRLAITARDLKFSQFWSHLLVVLPLAVAALRASLEPAHLSVWLAGGDR